MKKVLKWFGMILDLPTGLMLAVAVGMYLMGHSGLNKTYGFPPSNIVIPTDAASIEYGKHRAEALCQGCHAADMGGMINFL